MTCNKGGLDERERVQEIPYRDIWVYFNFVDFLMGGGGGGVMYVYLIPVCTWLTYNNYDYSAGVGELRKLSVW